MSTRPSESWLEAVLGDSEIAAHLGEAAQIAHMLRVEAAYAQALGAVGQVPAALAEEAAAAIVSAKIDRAQLAQAAAVDGLPVPGLIRQLKAALPARLHAALHTGLTSQDVMDSALTLALREVTALYEARLDALAAALEALAARVGDAPLMGRTRMQAALPVGTAHRIASWAQPLEAHRARLGEVAGRAVKLQLGGPVGTRASLGPEADSIAQAMGATLGLTVPAQPWHSDRQALVAYGAWAAGLSGHLGKIGHDVALMAQQGVQTVTLSGGGGSSAMAHKQNPIKAETLMTLARASAVQVATLHLALEHEQERSGTAWALEWLSLPPLLEAAGAGLARATALIGEVEAMGEQAGKETG